MAKIARKNMKIFGSSAGTNQIAEFGSLAAATPSFTTDPEVVQSLSNYLTGWFGAVLGGNSPAIEDMNALCFLYAYQLSYLMQEGVAEWNSLTTYFIGSMVNSGGRIYVSQVDNNLNNAVTTANWSQYSDSNFLALTASSTTYVMTTSDNGRTIVVNSAPHTQVFTLPAPVANFRIKIKDGGSAQTNNITINPHASENIDGLSSVVMSFNLGWIELLSDGTNWFIIDQSANVSPWATYTPTFTGFGTTSLVNFRWRRNRQVYEVVGNFNTGTVPATTQGSISLPSGALGLSTVPINFLATALLPSVAGSFQIFPTVNAVTSANITFLEQSSGTVAAGFTPNTTAFAANNTTLYLSLSLIGDGLTNF